VSEVEVDAIFRRKSCCKLVDAGGRVGLMKYGVSPTDSSKRVYYSRAKAMRCLETASSVVGGT
jgi:hypothetical protein